MKYKWIDSPKDIVLTLITGLLCLIAVIGLMFVLPFEGMVMLGIGVLAIIIAMLFF